MRPLRVVGPRGWRVLLPLLSALVHLSMGSEDRGCHDADLNITRSVGEQWLLSNCGGVATCRSAGYATVTSCPKFCGTPDDARPPTATFPRCCPPRLDCPTWYSEELQRRFYPGGTWTEGHCVRHQCKFGPSGSLELHRTTCERLGPPPALDCEVVDQDMARGGYPLCCAHYRCPGLCRAGDIWRPVGAVRGDSCSRTRRSAPSSARRASVDGDQLVIVLIACLINKAIVMSL